MPGQSSLTSRAALVLGLAALASTTAGCLNASDAAAFKDGDKARIQWDGTAARICVTEPGVECPKGMNDRISSGKVYWVVDAKCFPGGIDHPVEYGVVPGCAKDMTHANHGVFEPMKEGLDYQITVTGFGGSSSVTPLHF